MQINHNIRAMVTQQSLSLNDNAMARSLEKLSTGLRINRAQDDAAGLAMSEQMRTQIRGLGKAKRNAQDGQAALQIAEGALGEITNMMQRQKELAVQSANDTLTSTERMYLNDEFQALTKEIDRIAKNTDYNGKNVLLFDVDPNKSFGATKVDPYNKEISFLEAANVIYKAFGQGLNGNLSVLSDGRTIAAIGADTLKSINAVIGDINKVITDLKNSTGILTESNIKETLSNILKVNSITVVGLGGDKLYTNPVSFTSSLGTINATASNLKVLKEVNTFIKNVADALSNYNAAALGEFKPKEGAISAIKDILSTYTSSGLGQLKGLANSNLVSIANFEPTGIGALDRIISQLKGVNSLITNNGVDAKINASMMSKLAAVFSSTASSQMQNDLKTVLQIDTNKMAADTDKQTKELVTIWQKAIGELKDSYKVYEEADIATGSSSSEVLHVGPNYSSGLGGAVANQIKVNYTAIDVKGLGLQAQTIDTREGAQKAMDKLQETIKVISGNRASIGTYINRLDYTVNNIASMEYNIQDAESRIRDTDFATETTNFTRNQIMVQAATSMLAQANSLPQSVLGLIG